MIKPSPSTHPITAYRNIIHIYTLYMEGCSCISFYAFDTFTQPMSTSIYVHIPFCASRCAYCSFYSTVAGTEAKALYLQALKTEAAARATEAHNETVRSIYFGGGTPSQFTPHQIGSIMECITMHYHVEDNAEITLEANPDDINPDYATGIVSAGINRVSMGVQSFHNEVLAAINRRHNAAESIEAVETLYDAGIGNISIDLIYGLPHQDMCILEEDISKAVTLPVTHLSAYALSIEEGTQLYTLKAQGKITETPEDDFLHMYNLLCDRLQDAGFEHYEISNFCRKGFESRHNTGYWMGIPYIGLGPAAHSYDGIRTRRSNECNLKLYNRYWTMQNRETEETPWHIETLDDTELYDEKVMTRLRCSHGLDINDLSPKEQQYIMHVAQPFIRAGQLLIADRHRLCLSRKGIPISDAIMAELMWDTKFTL